MFLVFCVYMHSFAGLIRRMPPPMFSDTAITDCHSYTTIFQLRAHWVLISWSIGSELDMCPRWESNPRLPACKASTLSTRPGSLSIPPFPPPPPIEFIFIYSGDDGLSAWPIKISGMTHLYRTSLFPYNY